MNSWLWVVISTMGKSDKSDWQKMAGAISDCMVREQLSEKGTVELAIKESSS